MDSISMLGPSTTQEIFDSSPTAQSTYNSTPLIDDNADPEEFGASDALASNFSAALGSAPPDTSSITGTLTNAAVSVGSDALTGAALGSIVPGIGTVLGGLGGAIFGGISSLFGGSGDNGAMQQAQQQIQQMSAQIAPIEQQMSQMAQVDTTQANSLGKGFGMNFGAPGGGSATPSMI